MKRGITTARWGRSRPEWRRVVFTIPQARRALLYVSRVVADAKVAYRCVQECRVELMRVESEQRPTRRLRETLCARRDAALKALDSATDECNAVGAHLVDYSHGTVGFTAEVAGRPVSLLWRLGESIADAWKDVCCDGRV